MPRYKTHLIAAAGVFMVTLWCIGLCVTDCITATRWGCACLLGSLFPDIDISSKGQRYHYILATIALVFLLLKSYYALIIALNFCLLIPILSRHRGLFHTTWFIICFPLFCALLATVFFSPYAFSIFSTTFFFILGALSHLFLDFKVGPHVRSSRILRFIANLR